MKCFPGALFRGLLAVRPAAGPLVRQVSSLATHFCSFEFTLLINVTRKSLPVSLCWGGEPGVKLPLRGPHSFKAPVAKARLHPGWWEVTLGWLFRLPPSLGGELGEGLQRDRNPSEMSGGSVARRHPSVAFIHPGHFLPSVCLSAIFSTRSGRKSASLSRAVPRVFFSYVK